MPTMLRSMVLVLACVCLGTPHVDAFAPAAVRPLGASLSSLTRPAAAVSGTTMGLIPVPKLAKMGAVSKWGRRAQAVKRQLGGGSAAQEPGEVRKVPSRKGIFLLILTILFEVGGATCLKLAKDFTVALPSAMLFVFYGVMLLLLCTFFTT
ncbi:hypothetical protein T484DRAFT_3102944 [Baffinella frigidus]|nr:hypothetical protein T484DRAFT_3102944 [Cryptophyta sp. CCMP2293]